MKRVFVCLLTSVCCVALSAKIVIREVGGWLESGYVCWSLVDDAVDYNVYCQQSDMKYEVLDKQLLRNYATYGRADVLGITPGEYRFRVVALDSAGVEMEETAAESEWVTVMAHDHSGFAHLNYAGVGAYNDDGTLKNGAKVLYVTAETAKTVTCEVVIDSKGNKQTFTGLQTIIDARQKGYDKSPLAIRVIGTLYATDMDKLSSSAEGFQIKGKNAYSEMNITLEGVGNDATFYGFGLLIRNCTGVEVRNLGIMLCMDDCISIDTDNSHCWIHHVDFFYGQTGGDSDQAKGDGSLDCKGDSRYMTFSYNHFWDCGKMALCGMTSESGENFITYHHNWFDHSDSRHPRVRTMTVHVYNNYFDGVSKYGVGTTTGSNVFVESNYFRHTDRPMMISMQGTDVVSGKGTFSGEDGGMIKAYGNFFAEVSENFKLVTHKESATNFDCYQADTRDERVPETYITLQGGTCYNNFDTDPTKMYDYIPHDAEEVPLVVTGDYGAGRMQKGDFIWTFDNSKDDKDSEVNTALKNAIEQYETMLKGTFSVVGEEDEGNGDNEDEEEPTTPTLPSDGDYSCHFMGKKPSNDFYTIIGNYSNTKGSAMVNGVTYTDCLKIESSTLISFSITERMTLVLVFAEGSMPNIKVDGTKLESTGGNVIYCLLEPGKHEITKADTNNLFYINLEPETTDIMPAVVKEEIYWNFKGHQVIPRQKGIYIQNGRKFIVK